MKIFVASQPRKLWLADFSRLASRENQLASHENFWSRLPGLGVIAAREWIWLKFVATLRWKVLYESQSVVLHIETLTLSSINAT